VSANLPGLSDRVKAAAAAAVNNRLPNEGVD
jgi:hypothetical protein